MAEGFEREEPRYEGFDVPFSTASVGQFHGGIADNVVPRDAEFRYEFRDLPTADAAGDAGAGGGATRARWSRRCRRWRPRPASASRRSARSPASWARRPTPVTRLAQRLAGEQRTTLVAFGTEAGLFKNAGIPTVVCGPGSIAQAHQPDEYVSLEQLARCEAFMRGLAVAQEVG